MKRVINIICVGLGFACIGIGCVGIVLPVLPTTPFFLLALALFAKSSKRFHRWFMSTGLYKKHLEDFVETRSMTKAAKIKVLIVVTSLLAFGFYFSPGIAKIVIVLVAVFHWLYFVFAIKTVNKKETPINKSGI